VWLSCKIVGSPADGSRNTAGKEMMESTPEQNKATVLEAFDTLFNKRPAGGVLESGVSARARRRFK
jgi:hypothetical protein